MDMFEVSFGMERFLTASAMVARRLGGFKILKTSVKSELDLADLIRDRAAPRPRSITSWMRLHQARSRRRTVPTGRRDAHVATQAGRRVGRPSSNGFQIQKAPAP